MKKMYILFILLFAVSTVFTQTIEWQESFETDGDGGVRYQTSNFFNDGTNDHFNRTDGSDIGNVSGAYSAMDGTYFWAAEDTDDNGGDEVKEKMITFNSISVSGNGLVFKGLFGAGNENGAGASAYDAADYMIVEYSVDGGAFTKGLEFRYENNGDLYNEPLLQDTDFDGNGDGVKLVTAMQEITFALPSVTSSIQFRILVYMDSEDEEVAFDNFILEDTTPLPVELTSFTAKATEAAVVLNWTTATEVNNYGFDVESKRASTDTWETIAFVNGHGNSNSPKEYSYIVANATSGSYRLKQIDTDGGFEYSDVVTVGNAVNKLSQNYPNPFNPTTQISFSVAQASNVNISVYNALGQKVTELVNKNMNAGNHTVNFNGSNLASGFYFYRLDVGDYSKTMKMMLIK